MPAKHYHHSLMPGYQLHWYEVKSVLGRGGFGITYLAQDTNLNRFVAIKEYLPVDIAERDATDSVKPLEEEDREPYHWGLERFITEAQTLAQFEHPNIVRVLAVFRENNTGYMVMKYEKGEELQSILKRKQILTEAELKNITFSLLDGLEQVHQAGFIHRDIKPQNILIRPDGSPLLIDFGSARLALGGRTKTLTSLVTPGYAPFEQYYSKGDKQGPWTDIYSLAATLYACISGRPPLSAVDRSESIVQGTGDTLDSAENLGTKQYSKVFLKAIDRGLQFKPEDRPQSIAEWKADFKIVAHPKTPKDQEVARTFKGGAGKTSISTPPGIRRGYRSRNIYILAGSLLILAVCGLWIYQDNFISQEKPPVLQTPQPPPVATVSNKAQLQALQEDQIKKAAHAQLLEKARSALENRHYIQPEGDNAYLYFNQVLKLEPTNADAKRGLQQIAGQLVNQARDALKQDNLDQAGELLTQAEKIDPGAENLQSTRKLLNDRLVEKQKLLTDEQTKKQQALDEQKKAEEIKQLLATAKADVAAQRLTRPAGKNALDKYKKALALDPANAEAEQGIQDIVNRYIEQAKQMSAAGVYDNALAKLKLAEGISPGAENISSARQDIELHMKKAEEQRLAEEEKRKAEELARAEDARLKDEKIKQDSEKQIAEEKNTKEAVSTANITKKEQRILQANISTTTLQKAETQEPQGAEKKMIFIKYKGFDDKYQKMGLNKETIDNQIKALLNDAGFDINTDEKSLINTNSTIMELKFTPGESGQGIFRWNASVEVKSGAQTVWNDYYNTGDRGYIIVLNPAIDEYVKLVKRFIVDTKAK